MLRSAGVFCDSKLRVRRALFPIASDCCLHGAVHSFASDAAPRMVLAMMPVCLLGVVISVQPTLIFGGKERLNPLGVFIAIGQVPPICVNPGRAFEQFLQTRNGVPLPLPADANNHPLEARLAKAIIRGSYLSLKVKCSTRTKRCEGCRHVWRLLLGSWYGSYAPQIHRQSSYSLRWAIVVSPPPQSLPVLLVLGLSPQNGHSKPI